MANGNHYRIGTFTLLEWDNHEGERIDIEVSYEGHVEPQDSDVKIEVLNLENGLTIEFDELPETAQEELVEMCFEEITEKA